MVKNGIELIEKEIGNVVEIEENTYVWQMPSVMSRNFERLADYADAGCSEESGFSPYARYVGFDWEQELSKGMIDNILSMFIKKWHYFTGFPTQQKLDDADAIKANRIEKRRYVKACHFGPYHKVGSTYRKMFEWAKKQKIVLGNESIEFYRNDPAEVEKEKIETMVLIPVIEEHRRKEPS